MPYGYELILNLHNCSTTNFNRKRLEIFFIEFCELINMERAALHFWEYEDPTEYEAAPEHLKGISACQFITTSNIIIHTLDDLRQVYINIFSCKPFDHDNAQKFCISYFSGHSVDPQIVKRT